MDIELTSDFDTYVIIDIPVRIVCTDAPGECPVVAISETGGVYRRKAGGTYRDHAPITLTPKRIKCERWIVWSGGGVHGQYTTCEAAEQVMRYLRAHGHPAAITHNAIDLADGEVVE